MSLLLRAAFLVVLSLAIPAPVQAGIRCAPPSRNDPNPPCPLRNPDNGHYYLIGFGDDQPLGWHEASAAAEGLTFLGMTGYLATLTSEAEQDFLQSHGFLSFASADDLWIGASDAAVEGDWRWVTGPEAGQLFWRGDYDGEPFGFSPWHEGEPNDAGNEDYAVVRYSQQWNDLAPDFTRYTTGYLVEFSAVPEPSSIDLLTLGVVAMLGGRRANGAFHSSRPPSESSSVRHVAN
jgi:hypothetical protein